MGPAAAGERRGQGLGDRLNNCRQFLETRYLAGLGRTGRKNTLGGSGKEKTQRGDGDGPTEWRVELALGYGVLFRTQV
jgi:hypothetical protein